MCVYASVTLIQNMIRHAAKVHLAMPSKQRKVATLQLVAPHQPAGGKLCEFGSGLASSPIIAFRGYQTGMFNLKLLGLLVVWVQNLP